MIRVWDLQLTAVVALIAGLASAEHTACAQSQYEPHVISYDSGRLPDYPTADLIDLLSDASLRKNAHPTHGLYNVLPPDRRQVETPSGPDPKLYVRLDLDAHALDCADAVEQQLIARRPVEDLLSVFSRTPDWVQQAWMIDVLSRIRGARPDSVLRQFATDAKDQTAYFSLKYFVLACDSSALSILNHHYGQYPVPSLEWATVVRSFGDCKYTPSVPNLVNSLTALMVDLGYAAHRSLSAIYPDAAVDFHDPIRARNEWQKYLADRR